MMTGKRASFMILCSVALLTSSLPANAGVSAVVATGANDGKTTGCASLHGLPFDRAEPAAMREFLLDSGTYLRLPEKSELSLRYEIAASSCSTLLTDGIMALAEKDPSGYLRELERIERFAKDSPVSAVSLADLAASLQWEWEMKYLFEFYAYHRDEIARSRTLLFSAFLVSLMVGARQGATGGGPIGSFRTALGLAGFAERSSWALDRARGLKVTVPPPAEILSFAVPVEMDELDQVAHMRQGDEIISQSVGVGALSGATLVESELIMALNLTGWGRVVAWAGGLFASWSAYDWTERGTRHVISAARTREIDGQVYAATDEFVRSSTPAARASALRTLVRSALLRVAYQSSDWVTLERDNIPNLDLPASPEFSRRLATILHKDGDHLDPLLARDFARERLGEMLKYEYPGAGAADREKAVNAWDPELRAAGRSLVAEIGSAPPAEANKILESAVARDRRGLAAELIAHKLRDPADAFLFQVQALVRSAAEGGSDVRSQELLEKHVWDRILGSIIKRYRVFADNVTVQGAS